MIHSNSSRCHINKYFFLFPGGDPRPPFAVAALGAAHGKALLSSITTTSYSEWTAYILIWTPIYLFLAKTLDDGIGGDDDDGGSDDGGGDNDDAIDSDVGGGDKAGGDDVIDGDVGGDYCDVGGDDDIDCDVGGGP